MNESPNLVVRTAPFAREGTTTPGLMRDVLLALVPVMGAAVWFFGLSAVLLSLAAVAGCVVTEWLFDGHRPRGSSLRDGSAILTGILLALTLPPGMPMWMAFLGGVAGIGLGKAIWGGLGQNLFNPALVGRAFLQAAFPTAITTWVAQGRGPLSVHPGNLALPFTSGAVDGVSTATPLGLMKFQHLPSPLLDLFVGNTAGSLGETSGVLLLLVGAWLAWRRVFDWRIPASILLAAGVMSAIVWVATGFTSPNPAFVVLSGGLLFGAVFMATDPVTSPTTPLGTWIYGAGIGILVVTIRFWGGLPEGVMYSILLMNAVSPLLTRAFRVRPFGRMRTPLRTPRRPS